MPEAITTSNDEADYDPSVEPEKSGAWLALIEDAQKKFETWQLKARKIEQIYASLSDKFTPSIAVGDRHYAIFWANIEVLKPSIYARPPVPVVVPRFKDRRPVPRVASELLERSCSTAFDLGNIDGLMKLVRDDLALNARGVGWVRYEDKAEGRYKGEKICLDYVDREDFVHDPARDWYCVGWVARRCWMTRDEMKARWPDTKKWDGASFMVGTEKRGPIEGIDPRERCPVWELWSKTEDKVVWVTEGVENVIESDKPHLELEGFFPCPRPALGTLEPRTLVPVPDFIQYQDQLDEIDKLTNRIHALADAIQVKGFFAAGGDIGDAIEKALTLMDDRRVMIPVSSMGAFGGQSGDPIVWLPIDMIATTIQGLIQMRQQLIADVYQITGISDILRGESDPNETATAQQIKAQSGSVRIRDKQQELVRFARDIVRIAAEIMAEHFSMKTLLAMSQMEIPTEQDMQRQIKPLEDQAKAINAAIKQVERDPRMRAEAEANPEAAQQKLQQAQQQVQQIMAQVAKLNGQPTVEDVQKLLRDQKIRPFVLDIETDSTIQADEQAEKQARTEFVTALAGLVAQFAPVIQMQPSMAPMVGELIKFALAPFRVGRELEGAIDEALEGLIAQSQQPRPNPEAEALKAEQAMEQQKMQFEMQKQQAEDARKDRELQAKIAMEEAKLMAERESQVMDAQFKAQENEAKLAQIAAQTRRDEQKGALEVQKLQMEIERMQLEGAIKIRQADQQAAQSTAAFEQKAALNAQAAQQKQQGGLNGS